MQKNRKSLQKQSNKHFKLNKKGFNSRQGSENKKKKHKD